MICRVPSQNKKYQELLPQQGWLRADPRQEVSAERAEQKDRHCWTMLESSEGKERKIYFAGGREAGAKERKGERLFSGSAEEREDTRLGGKLWVKVAEGLHLQAPGRDRRWEDLRRREQFAMMAERGRLCQES